MELEIGEKVDLVIGRFTNVGISVLVNDEYEGLLYKNEVFRRVREGQKVVGYIKKLREDGGIDVSLQPIGFLNKIGENEAVILEKLQSLDNGFIGYNDKSKSEDIMYHFKMSKKSFKSAIGGLYKAKKIIMTDEGIELIEERK
jgi:predicted RNA-binding protein (virulence factor B family)